MVLQSEDKGQRARTEQRQRQLSDGAKRECSKTGVLGCACSTFVV